MVLKLTRRLKKSYFNIVMSLLADDLHIRRPERLFGIWIHKTTVNSRTAPTDTLLYLKGLCHEMNMFFEGL
jgi:hypothetical protein